MEYKSVDAVVASLIKEAVESEGCRLAELDLESLLARVEGSDDIVGNCARAVEEILE